MRNSNQLIFHYPVFNGDKVIENAALIIEDGVIMTESRSYEMEYEDNHNRRTYCRRADSELFGDLDKRRMENT